MIVLGSIAHHATVQAQALKKSDYASVRNHQYLLGCGMIMIDSYHCGRYSTQTKRLTTAMFEEVFAAARTLLSKPDHG